MIYLDNAATTRVSDDVIAAMSPYMRSLYGNPSSLHKLGQISKNAIENARKQLADSFGCKPEGVIFTSGGSEADNQALMFASQLGKQKNKMHIVSTNIEHHAILNTLERLKTEGFEIDLLPVDDEGYITPEQVRKAIKKTTCLVTVMYANNEIGTVQPIKEIGAICKEKGVIFHTDAVQAAGHLRINMEDENIDMLSISAHKFHGPKGIGALVSRIKVSPFVLGGGQERGMRAGTENVPAIVGMGAALNIANNNLNKNIQNVLLVRTRMIEEMLKIEGASINGGLRDRLVNNISISFENVDNEALVLMLDDYDIYVSAGSACSHGSASHVLQAIHKNPDNAIRITVDENIDEHDVMHVVSVIKKAVKSIRNMQGGNI